MTPWTVGGCCRILRVVLSFSSNAFKRTTLEEAIGTIASLGYVGVELMADVPHAYPLPLSNERRRSLGKLVADLGLVVSNVNAFTLFACGDTYHPTWIEHDPADRARRVEHTRHAVRLAAEFGCRTVSLQPGGPLIATGLSREEAGKRFADGISQCLHDARAHGVVLAIEPEPGLFIQTSGEYLDWKRTFFAGEPAVRMNADLGHLFCVGEDPAAVLRAHHAEIAHVHLEDIGANRVHQHLTPGRGAMDFAAIFEAMRETGFAGHATVELYPYELGAAGVARAAIEHLTPILRAASAARRG